jgi:hypothetical protein
MGEELLAFGCGMMASIEGIIGIGGDMEKGG